MINCVFAQKDAKASFCFAFQVASQSSFGPTESQAEIVGGMDTLYYDNKAHFIPGFRSSMVSELAIGYRKNILQWQSTISYFVKDIGLIQKVSSNEYPFMLADMLSIKISAHLQLTNNDVPKPDGLLTGFFVGSFFPVAYKMDPQTKADFAVKDFNPSAQLCWGIDLQYNKRLAHQGWYIVAGITGTMPGLVGGIGKIELQAHSPYQVKRDEIKMYAISGFLGIGKCFSE